jgi:hypothetical protein
LVCDTCTTGEPFISAQISTHHEPDREENATAIT